MYAMSPSRRLFLALSRGTSHRRNKAREAWTPEAPQALEVRVCPANIDGTESDDRSLFGTSGDDFIRGLGGNDFIGGQGGRDTIEGNGGNDELYGGADSDISIRGGQGNDSIFGEDGDEPFLSGDIGNDTILGGRGMDTLYGDNPDSNATTAATGDDTLFGEDGTDTLYGDTTDADRLDGGMDVLHGGPGDDFLFGGAGNDTLDGNDDNDVVNGGRDNDTVRGGNGNDTVQGGKGDDQVFGDAGNDTLEGGEGVDTLRGGTGLDNLLGGPGNDVLFGDEERDTLNGEADNDQLNGGDGNDDLFGGTGDDVLNGGSGDDAIFGNEDNDVISASTGHDIIDAGSGNDLVETAVNTSQVTLGSGADRLFPTGSANATTTVTDFSVAEDRFDFSQSSLTWAVMTLVDGPGGVVLNLPNSSRVILQGVTRANLTRANFINIANTAPSSLALSNSSVVEGLQSGTLVGNLSAIDPDFAETLMYSLVAGAGGDDNAVFSLSGVQLRTGQVFDRAVQTTRTVRVRATDISGANVERSFTINILSDNASPTSLSLSNTSLVENLASGAFIGSFSTVDPDAGDTHSYQFVSGTGSTDNGLFSISGSQLQSATSFNFEAKSPSTYAIRVRTTDGGGQFVDQTFTITVNNQNETPTGISASNLSVAENFAVGGTIGTLSATDPDAGDTFVFTLVTDSNGPDSGLFSIQGNRLVSGTGFDFETKRTYALVVRVTDAGGLSIQLPFMVNVSNIPEPPTAPALSNTVVPENQAPGFVVGNLTGSDPDAGDSAAFSFGTGPGDTDNGLFRIFSGQLVAAVAFDFEARSQYSVRIRSTDIVGLFTDRTFIITVGDVVENSAPVLDNTGAPYYIAGVGRRIPTEMTSGILVSEILKRGANGGRPITDADANPLGVAILSADESYGVWQFSTVANPTESDWTNFNASGAVTADSALLLRADATTRVRLKSLLVPHHQGTVAQGFLPLESKLDAGLIFRAWDQSAGVAGGRASTQSNGGTTAFSVATEAVSVFFEARLWRSFNTNAALNVYTLEAEFFALIGNTAFEDRATSAWTGFTVFLSPLTTSLPTTGLIRMYYGVQFNADGTETDMGYRYLTTNPGEADVLEAGGPASKRPLRAGTYFRELDVGFGSAVTGYVYSTLQEGTRQLSQTYRLDNTDKPTRGPGTREGDRPTSARRQEVGDHVYTTNPTFENAKQGMWRTEAPRGFARELTPNPTGFASAIASPADESVGVSIMGVASVAAPPSVGRSVADVGLIETHSPPPVAQRSSQLPEDGVPMSTASTRLALPADGIAPEVAEMDEWFRAAPGELLLADVWE
jgi:Ca2+-binding RTX toxin-like protein